MKRFFFLVLLIVFSVLDVHAQRDERRKARLSFQQGDLMFYVMSGYPKIPDLTILGLGNDITDIPPIGSGLHLSVIDYLSLGIESIYTYKIFEQYKITQTDLIKLKRSYIILVGKLLFHYPFRFFDPYFGGGAGYMWLRHPSGISDQNSAGLYWTSIIGFRFAFGSSAPFGIFFEVAYPYPLISGGIYFRFKMF